ncbi:MAG TPA: serine hydrolase [Kribbella sp.]|nr:serine hydrolase [Kribbella sp.]
MSQGRSEQDRQDDEPRDRPDVSASSWLEAPHNRWSMWNVRKVAPTLPVSRGDGETRHLSLRPTNLDQITVVRAGGAKSTVREILDSTFTDAFAVAQDGALVSEWYAPDGGPDRLHAVLSVTKSLVGCVAGLLIDHGAIAEHRRVADYLPELGRSGYAEATVRQLLDMRSGVRFREDYTDSSAEIREMDDWVLGDRGLYAFLATLEAERPHGGHFLYRSSETDVLGWVCERVTGSRMPSLLSDLIWSPMGAGHDAEILCDGLGTAIHDGGFGATTRDLLRFAQLLLDGGTVPLAGGGVRNVVPAQWLRRSRQVDADIRRAFLDSPAEAAFPGGWYRNQFWFRSGPLGDVLLCLGIHGQLVYACRRTRTVCVKLSSWPEAQNPSFLQDTLRACDAVSGALTGRRSTGQARRLPGVVSGR